MTALQAIRSCLRQFVGFSGRAPRSEYWWWTVCAGLVLTVVFVVYMASFGMEEDVVEGTAGAGMSGSLARSVLFVVLMIPSLSVTVRRLHDTNWSGWWALSMAVCGAVHVYGIAFGPFALGVAFASTPVLITYLTASALSLVVFIRMFFRGAQGENRYGSDPLSRVRVSEA